MEFAETLLPLKNAAVARLIGRWPSFYRWLGGEKGFKASPDPDSPQHCPAHGGNSGAAFRFYPDMPDTGGGVCNSCQNLRASNGADLVCGWLLETKQAKDARDALITLSEWVDAYCGKEKIPTPTPMTARRLTEWVGSTEGPSIVSAYLRKRGIPVLPNQVPPSLRAITLNSASSKTKLPEIRGLLLVDNTPLTYYRILLSAAFEKRYPKGHPKEHENKKPATIHKERKLSGAYVPLGVEGSPLLFIAEGIETGMAVRFLHGKLHPDDSAAVRASVGPIHKHVAVPDTAKTIIVCGENDHTLDGTQRCVDGLRVAYSDVRFLLMVPPDGKKDWNHVLADLGEVEALSAFGKAYQEALAASPEPGQLGGETPPDQLPAPPSPDQPSAPKQEKKRVVSLPETDDSAMYKHFESVYDGSPLKPWFWSLNERRPVKVGLSTEPVTDRMVAGWLSDKMTFLNSRAECVAIPTGRVGLWMTRDSTTDRLKSSLRPLQGVLSRPAVMRNCVSVGLLKDAGYDAATKFHLNLSDTDAQACGQAEQALGRFRDRALAERAVSDLPSAECAARAERALAAWSAVVLLRDHLLVDFQFASRSDEANAWAAALTPPLAPQAGKVPFILVMAPQRGSGKTLFTNLITKLWEAPASQGFPESEEELEKCLGTAFNSGRSLVILDNVVRKIQSATIARIVTSPELASIRRLGGNESMTPPPGLTLYATANNPDLHEDIKRRTLPIRLDPRGTDPAKRLPNNFRHPDMETYLSDELVSLRTRMYTALLAWTRAGAPESPSNVYIADFSKWQRCTAGLLRFIGRTAYVSDLLKNREAFMEGSDSATEETDEVVKIWTESKPVGEWTTVTELVQMADQHGVLAWVIEPRLEAAKTKRMGAWLKRLVGRKFEVGNKVLLLERSDKRMRADYTANPSNCYRLSELPAASVQMRTYRKDELLEFNPDELELERLLNVAGVDPTVDQWFDLALPWILGRNRGNPAPAAPPGPPEPVAAPTVDPAPAAKPDSGQASPPPVREPGSDDDLGGEPEATSGSPPAERAPFVLDMQAGPEAVVAGSWAPDDEALFQSLENSPWKCVDTETTALTAYSEPINTREGDPRPRVRIVSAVWQDGEAAWDLDTLAPERKARLARAALTKTLVAHNSPFDMNWLRPLAGPDARPAGVIDTMMLGRLLAPDTPMRLSLMAVSNPEAAAMIAGKVSGWSLAAMMLVHLGAAPDKTLQKPHNWVGRAPLSAAHYAYAIGDPRDTLRLLLHLTQAAPGTPPIAAINNWLARQDATTVKFARLWRQVPAQLSDMHLTGVPFDVAAAEKYVESCLEQAREATSKIIADHPAILEPVRHLLEKETTGLKHPALFAIAEAFASHGIKVTLTPESKLPEVGEKALRAVGATSKAPELFNAWAKRARALRRAEMAEAFAKAAGPDGRIRGLYSPVTTAGRIAASEPNMQQVPADEDFRALINNLKAKMANAGDYVIVSCDYSALDMRVGASLALAEQDVVKLALEDDAACRGYYGSLAVRNQLRRLWDTLAPLALKEKDGRYSALRAAFRAELDIHSWTAVRLANGNPAAVVGDLVGELGKKALDAEIARLGGSRKLGKVSNLGLLYAMGVDAFTYYAAASWDVHLSAEEGSTIIKNWLGTYLELELWRRSTMLRAQARDGSGKQYLGRVFGRSEPVKLSRYECNGISGRRFIASTLSTALSYPDQGSGADILMTAVDLLYQEHRDLYNAIILQVHDELVLELPRATAEKDGQRLRATMLRAAEAWTQPYGVPMQAELSIGDTWS